MPRVVWLYIKYSINVTRSAAFSLSSATERSTCAFSAENASPVRANVSFHFTPPHLSNHRPDLWPVDFSLNSQTSCPGAASVLAYSTVGGLPAGSREMTLGPGPSALRVLAEQIASDEMPLYLPNLPSYLLTTDTAFDLDTIYTYEVHIYLQQVALKTRTAKKAKR